MLAKGKTSLGVHVWVHWGTEKYFSKNTPPQAIPWGKKEETLIPVPLCKSNRNEGF